jgi:hypothetical protein
MTIAQCKSARHRNIHRYSGPRRRSVSEAIAAERQLAARAAAAMKKKTK